MGDKEGGGVHWDTFLKVHFCLVLVLASTLVQCSLKSLPLHLHSALLLPRI